MGVHTVGELLRLMPNYDPCWRERLEMARLQRSSILAYGGLISTEKQGKLRRLRNVIKTVLQQQFRTTAEYRDYHIAELRLLVEQEGLILELPVLANDATIDDIDAVIAQVWREISPHNSVLQVMLNCRCA